jgi:hypothetical protein
LDLVDILVVNGSKVRRLSGETRVEGIAVALARRFLRQALTLGEHGVIYRSGELTFSVPAPRAWASIPPLPGTPSRLLAGLQPAVLTALVSATAAAA